MSHLMAEEELPRSVLRWASGCVSKCEVRVCRFCSASEMSRSVSDSRGSLLCDISCLKG